MAVYNVFVKLLDGSTATLKFSTPTISGEFLKTHLHNLTQIPPQNQRLVTGNQQLHDQTLITIPNGGFFTIHLLLRLLGGKGGFGSLLRGAATKAGQKKTNNFDACRDMSGRRLRHVNAEKKLEEWKAEAEERKLEKVAEDFIKKKSKAVKKSGSGESEKYIAKYREDSEKCMEDVEAAVRESFKRSEDAKRKIMPSSGASKRLKLWMTKGKAEESDSDDEDDDEEDERYLVLDDANHAKRSKDGEGSSRSVLEAPGSEGESSGGASLQNISVEENGIAKHENVEVEGPGASLQNISEEENGIANHENVEVEGPGSVEVHDKVDETVEPKIHEGSVTESELATAEESVPLEADFSVCEETVGPSANGVSLEVVEGSESKDTVVEANGSVAIAATEMVDDSSPEKPLDFNDYNSANEMEVFGMERLKAELQARGLKCGGTLQERAARLFLLKTTPLDKLPKKLLAKK